MSARDAALLALGEAIQFESDGRDFYLRAAQAAQNSLARAVFEALAEDEVEHVRRVREIFEELKDKQGWPDVTAMVARVSGVVDAFEQTGADGLRAAGADATAADALVQAEEMERKGLGFYRDRVARATCAAEAEFFRRLVAEEEAHLAAIGRVRLAAAG